MEWKVLFSHISLTSMSHNMVCISVSKHSILLLSPPLLGSMGEGWRQRDICEVRRLLKVANFNLNKSSTSSCYCLKHRVKKKLQATNNAVVYNVQLITLLFYAYPLRKKSRGKEKRKTFISVSKLCIVVS